MASTYKTKLFTQTTLNAVLLSAVMSVLMFPSVFFGYRFMDMGFLAWGYLVPLLVAIHPYSFKSKFVLTFLYGLLASFGQFYWLNGAIHQFGGLDTGVSIAVVVFLGCVLGGISAAFISSASWVNHMNKIPLALLLPAFLIARDLFLHVPVGGFPWALPAYSQGNWLRFFQWVDHTGALGLDVYIYVVNALIAEALILLFYRRQIDKTVSRFLMVFFLMMLSFSMSFLASQDFEKKKETLGTITLALIQGNIEQDLKWNPDKSQENLQRYLRLTNLAVQNGAELVIWPETAYPYGINEKDLSGERFLEQDQLPAPIFFGAVTASHDGDKMILHNSVLQADRYAKLINIYHKMHLVPYGEYVPLMDWIPFLKNLTKSVGEFQPGTTYDLFTIGKYKFGSLICFEDVFIDNARMFAKLGADVLVNYTNDAWYGNSSAPYQHLVFSQFRALENRLPLVRATNTGMTAVIAANGEIIADLPIFKEKYMLHTLKIEKGASFFTQHGDAWAYYLSAIAGVVFLYTVAKWFLGPVKKEF
jgi:apolipoprotein N-acyltransferase